MLDCRRVSTRTTRTALVAAVDELLEQRLAAVARTTPGLRGGAARLPAALGSPVTPPRRGARSPGSAGSRTCGGGRTPGAGSARRARPLRRAGLPAGPADRAARLRAPRACCSCSTRSRRCSGCAATSGTRRSTRCGSSSTRSTPAASPGCTSSSPGRRRSSTGRRACSGSPPLAQRLATDFTTDPRFDNPRAVQLRLPGFDLRRAASSSARRVRDLYAGRAPAPGAHRGHRRRRLRRRAGAGASPGSWAGRSGSPRGCSCKKLVSDVLDRVDQFADFDPRRHYALTLARSRADRGASANAAARADDVDLDRRRRCDRVSDGAATGCTRSSAPHRQQPGLADAAAAAGGRRSSRCWPARDALLLAPDRGRQDRGGVLPAADRDGRDRLDRAVGALRLPAEGAAEQPAAPPGRRTRLARADASRSGTATSPPPQRQRILRDPPDVLLTTPESLEAMLVSRRSSTGSLLGDLRAVVVDEVHAFAGDDRGWHLLAVLERLTRLCGRPLQRIGLSATVGNPEELLDLVAGCRPRASGRRRRAVGAPARVGRRHRARLRRHR